MRSAPLCLFFMPAKPHSFHTSHTASCVFRLAALYDQRACAVVVTPDARQPQHLPPPEARLEGLDGLQETREGHPSPLAGLGDSGRHELEPQALCLSSRELGCNAVPSAKQMQKQANGASALLLQERKSRPRRSRDRRQRIPNNLLGNRVPANIRRPDNVSPLERRRCRRWNFVFSGTFLGQQTSF